MARRVSRPDEPNEIVQALPALNPHTDGINPPM